MTDNIPKFELGPIVTLECYFKRDHNIDDRYAKCVNNLKVDTSKSINEDEIIIFLTVNLTQSFENTNLVEVKVTNAAGFKKIGEMTQQVIDDFCNINAPAIIFPFIRETIASLSTKAGLMPIIIQPVNFVDLNKKKTEL
jgi:preprotein translocase subunit SecB